MKKQIAALVLASVLCLGGLSACGGSSNTASNTNANNTNTTATTTNTNNTSSAKTNTNATANTNSNAGVASSAVATELQAKLATCYMGIGTNGVDTYYLGFSADTTWGVVIILDTDTGKYASWVGDATANGNNSYTVADETNQTTLTFTAIEQTDGTWLLDCGSTLGTAYVASCTTSDLASALAIIDAEGTPIM